LKTSGYQADAKLQSLVLLQADIYLRLYHHLAESQNVRTGLEAQYVLILASLKTGKRQAGIRRMLGTTELRIIMDDDFEMQ
jgi:hypothetical protein